jgi:hypothetical protein
MSRGGQVQADAPSQAPAPDPSPPPGCWPTPQATPVSWTRPRPCMMQAALHHAPSAPLRGPPAQVPPPPFSAHHHGLADLGPSCLGAHTPTHSPPSVARTRAQGLRVRGGAGPRHVGRSEAGRAVQVARVSCRIACAVALPASRRPPIMMMVMMTMMWGPYRAAPDWFVRGLGGSSPAQWRIGRPR